MGANRYPNPKTHEPYNLDASCHFILNRSLSTETMKDWLRLLEVRVTMLLSCL